MELLRKLWQGLATPSARYALGALILAGGVAGAFGVVAFNEVMHATNTNDFCISCHELEVNAYQEFVGTSHHTNKTGLAATCGDCHVPREFFPKMWRKIRAVGEVYYHITGLIDTPEKYDAHRMAMATKTWAEMDSTDSRNCRYCHDEESWDLAMQSEKAQEYHGTALSKGKTCIDCHKGLAHKLPPEIEADTLIEGIDF